MSQTPKPVPADPSAATPTAHPHLSADTLAAAERARDYWAARHVVSHDDAVEGAVPADRAEHAADEAASYTSAGDMPTGSTVAPA